VDDSDFDGQPVRKRKTPTPPSRLAVGRSSSSPPKRPAKKTVRPAKKKKGPTDDIDSNDHLVEVLPSPPKPVEVPSSPSKPVVKKTSKPVKKKVAASPDLQLRRSPRQQKPSAREVLAAKMKIGADIIPGAVTVVPVS